MLLNVLIIPDKFKSTLLASQAAQAIARGWRRARPQDSLALLPMSDGGDGFGEVISKLLRAQVQTIRTVDAAHRSRKAKWWWEPKTRTAIIESAEVIGLALLPPKHFHPFELDTFGLAAMLQAAAAQGAKRCLMGIGGSATNEGGFGLARALGWGFADRNGKAIERWTGLHNLNQIHAPRRRRWFRELLVAVDVQNELLGPSGATRVYGPQKGLRQGDFQLAEGCLRHLASAVQKKAGREYARLPGAGAAGGLGFGLAAFLGARLEPGFELFGRHAALARHLSWADLVVTGEGTIDDSTLMGKGVGQIAQRCLDLSIPCIGLTGTSGAGASKLCAFTQTHALTRLTTVEQAKAKPAFWLERLAQRVAQGWGSSS